MNSLREKRLIKAGEKEQFFIKEMTYIPSFSLDIKKIIYINPITEKSYKGVTGSGALSSTNPNINNLKFDK